jgi:hypothetical protein
MLIGIRDILHDNSAEGAPPGLVRGSCRGSRLCGSSDVVHGGTLALRRHSLGVRDSWRDSRAANLSCEVGIEQARSLRLRARKQVTV